MMLEERTLLASHEARVKKTRTTKVAFQALADSEIPADIPDDVANLVNELMGERQALRDARKLRECERPLKGMLVYLNSEHQLRLKSAQHW
jgi:E3 ubiquitin-protein ligase SHPRH